MKAAQPDRPAIQRALGLLAAPGQVVELRLLDVQCPGQRIPRTMSGYCHDFGLLADSASRYNGAAKGVYITLNPVNPAFFARAANRLRTVGKDDSLTGDADITKRRWLPIDLDPVRPSGISSTEQEHALAVERAFQIREALRQVGWPDPIVGDSGNGAHLLYSVELPTSDDQLVKRCLKALARRFDDDRVKIDQAVFNPARIWKLYGTVSRKGNSVPKRPHRLACILEGDAPTPVPMKLLEGLAAAGAEKTARPLQTSMPAAGFDLRGLDRRQASRRRKPRARKGGQRWIFRICPWNGAHSNKSAYVVQLPNGAIAAGCHHNGCNEKDWHSLRDQMEPGWRSAGQHTTVAEAHRGGPGWEPPLPFHQIDLPAFPTDALPDWLRSFVEAEATATQTPIDLAGMLTLSVIAACCAKKVAVCMREGYVEPVNLFTATALPSGIRKTAVFAAATKPLEYHERLEAQRTSSEIARQRTERQIKQSALRKLQEQAAGARGKDQEKLAQEAAALAVELETTSTASPTRYIAMILRVRVSLGVGRATILKSEHRYGPRTPPTRISWLASGAHQRSATSVGEPLTRREVSPASHKANSAPRSKPQVPFPIRASCRGDSGRSGNTRVPCPR